MGPSLTVTLTLTVTVCGTVTVCHRLTDTVDVHIMWPHALAGGVTLGRILYNPARTALCHPNELTVCSTQFKLNIALSSTEFEPKSIPYLVRL